MTGSSDGLVIFLPVDIWFVSFSRSTLLIFRFLSDVACIILDVILIAIYKTS